MRESRALRLFQGLILLSLAGLMAGKVFDGSIGFYINRSLAGITLAGAMVLAPLGLAAVWAALRGHDHVHSHDDPDDDRPVGQGPTPVQGRARPPMSDLRRLALESAPDDPDAPARPSAQALAADAPRRRVRLAGGRWLVAGLLAVPLAIGLLPPRPLDSAALIGRGMSSGPALADTAAAPAALAPRERTIFDWVRLARRPGGLDPLVGQPVDVVGFVYRAQGTEADPTRFTVARFTVTCCAADASGVGLAVRAPAPVTLPADTWVRVVGTLGLETIKGETVPVVFAEQLTGVAQPADPYLYP